MKKLTVFVVIIVLLSVAACLATDSTAVSVKVDSNFTISGFGQVKYDSSNFGLPKGRVIVSGPVEIGIKNIRISYKTYVDFDKKEGKPELGFAQINFQFPINWAPKIIVGRTLDPLAYQFPGPHQLWVLNYPAAFFTHPMNLGVFLQEDWKSVWAMAGLVNGTPKFEDDNKSLDFTGRLAYSLPMGFTIGTICWSGQQPDGYRRIFGGDLSWKLDPFLINGGQNVFDYNGHKIGRWLVITTDFLKYFQLVGLLESLKSGDKTANGWSAGINFFPSSKTIVRFNFYQLAVNKRQSWGILCQQSF